MLYQKDIDIIDDHLAGEEDDGLHSFTERGRQFCSRVLLQLRWNRGEEVGEHDRERDSGDGAENPVAELDQYHGTNELGARFQNEVPTQPLKGTSSLQASTLHAEGDIEGNS